MDCRTQRQSAAFLWSDRGLFLGDRSETAVHAHDAVELSVALDSLGLDVQDPQGPHLRSAQAVLVRSSTTHRLTIHGPKVAVFYVDPRSADGAGLERWLGSRTIAAAPPPVGQLRASLQGLFGRRTTLADGQRVCDELLASILPADHSRARSKALDPRIEQVKALVLQRLGDAPRRDELAAAVGLSESRLGHLFRAQMGLPLRRWILWMRLRSALDHALSGASMTEAAFAAGFSDGAHFTRTCQQMFGLPPSEFAPVEGFFVDRS
ncbi:MAG: AraC family transcriptional regulator [Myxococcota bacterium]